MNSKTTIHISEFGKDKEGNVVKCFTLKQRGGLIAKIINFGAILTELHVPNKDGEYLDVVLGFNDVETYLDENIYAGAIVGRVAGRIANAIFNIDDVVYKITNNENNNHLHGGVLGIDKKLWSYKILETQNGEVLELSVFSPDGEEGFPGNVNITVKYSLTNENGLEIKYRATTDKVTPICLTNHTYFNLSGEADIKNHSIQIDSEKVVEVDDDFIPTGNINVVKKGVNDFREVTLFGNNLGQLQQEHGDNYLLETNEETAQKVATLKSKNYCMDVFTTASNLQLYSGMGLQTKAKGKQGKKYEKFAGLCLECQGFPGALHHKDKAFKSILLKPNEIFNQVTEFRFSK